MYCVCLMEDDQVRHIPAVDGDGKRVGKKRATGEAVEEGDAQESGERSEIGQEDHEEEGAVAHTVEGCEKGAQACRPQVRFQTGAFTSGEIGGQEAKRQGSLRDSEESGQDTRQEEQPLKPSPSIGAQMCHHWNNQHSRCHDEKPKIPNRAKPHPSAFACTAQSQPDA